MLDETVGLAVAARLGPDEFPPILELKINFIAPVDVGFLIGEGRIASMGKSICFLEGKLLDRSGRLIATGTATARILRRADKTI